MRAWALVSGSVVCESQAGSLAGLAATVHGTTQVHSCTVAANKSLAPSGVPVTDTGLLFSDGPDAVLTAPQ